MNDRIKNWKFTDLQCSLQFPELVTGNFQSETVVISRTKTQQVITHKITGATRKYKIVSWLNACSFIMVNENNNKQVFLFTIKDSNKDFYTYTLEKLDPEIGVKTGQRTDAVHYLMK